MYLLLDLLHPVECDPAAGFETAPALGGAGAAALLNNRIAQRVLDPVSYTHLHGERRHR